MLKVLSKLIDQEIFDGLGERAHHYNIACVRRQIVGKGGGGDES